MKPRRPAGEKALDDAWKLLRFSLRDAGVEYARAHMTRLNSLPPDPPDPEVVAPLARAITNELERLAGDDERSPVLRFVKVKILPNRIGRTRKRLVKVFDRYLGAWKKEHPG